MKRVLWIATSLAGFFALACSAPRPAIDLEAERQALRSAAEAYHEAGLSLDVDKLVSFYTGDSRIVPPNSPEENGAEGFRKVATAIIGLPGLKVRFDNLRVEVSAGGDMGYTLADAEFNFQGPSGEPVQEKLRDFHLWKKDAAGSWKVSVDIWNSALPPPAPQ